MATDIFLHLSCALTGEDTLDAQHALETRQRIEYYYADEIKQLLDAFAAALKHSPPEQAVREALGDDEKLHAVARAVLRVWYTGEFETQHEGIDPPTTHEQFERGLLWKVIQSHAPAFTNAGYGVWAKAPASVGSSSTGSNRHRE